MKKIFVFIVCFLFIINVCSLIFSQEQTTSENVSKTTASESESQISEEKKEIETSEVSQEEIETEVEEEEIEGKEEKEEEKEEEEEEKSAKKSEEVKITLTLKNVDIKVFLQAISKLADVNIIPGPEVEATISANLKDVPWKQALDTILKAYGYGFEEIYPRVYLVTTLERLAAKKAEEAKLKEVEELKMKRIPLTFLKAEEVNEVVKNFLSSRGKTVVDLSSNSIVVIDIEENIKKIENYIKEVDEETLQVLLDVKVVEVSLEDLQKLGIKWQASARATAATRPTKFPFKDKYINTRNFFKDFSPWPFPTPGDDLFSFGTLSAANTEVVFDFIFNKTKGKIISQPKIVVLNHKEGFIEIKTQEPIERATYDSGTGDYVYSVEEKEYGVQLKVTPHINKEGYITLELEPQVSDKLRDKQLPHSGEVPVISSNTTKTTVILKHGETLVIGGVIKRKVDIEEQKIPLLGDIPVVGNLFRYNSTESTRDELLIFITPHIIGKV